MGLNSSVSISSHKQPLMAGHTITSSVCLFSYPQSIPPNQNKTRYGNRTNGTNVSCRRHWKGRKNRCFEVSGIEISPNYKARNFWKTISYWMIHAARISQTIVGRTQDIFSLQAIRKFVNLFFSSVQHCNPLLRESENWTTCARQKVNPYLESPIIIISVILLSCKSGR